jgi:hypothetical protein
LILFTFLVIPNHLFENELMFSIMIDPILISIISLN